MTRLLKHLVGRHAQLFLHVQCRGGDKRVNATPFGAFEGLGRARNIAVIGSGQRAHRGILNGLGNGLNSVKVTIGTGRKTSLDHVHLESLQLASDAQFLVFGHRGARGLLAIAQGGVKNDQLVAHVAAPVQEKSWPKNKRPVALAYGP
jgi:hypothetical protein